MIAISAVLGPLLPLYGGVAGVYDDDAWDLASAVTVMVFLEPPVVVLVRVGALLALVSAGTLPDRGGPAVLPLRAVTAFRYTERIVPVRPVTVNRLE